MFFRKIISFSLIMISAAVSLGSEYCVTRKLTENEKKILHAIFPNMKLDNVLVTGEVDKKYNCVAWTLGFADRNIPKAGGTLSSQAEMDAVYAHYQYRPTEQPSSIAVMGASREEIAHVAIFHGPTGRWESKIGDGLRIVHDLKDLEWGNNNRYGVVLYYYEKVK